MIPTRTQRDPAAYRRNCCVSLSEGCGPARSLRPHRNRNRNPCHRCAPTASPPPLVVRGQHLTDSVAFPNTAGHNNPLSVGRSSRFPSESCGRCVRVTAAPPEVRRPSPNRAPSLTAPAPGVSLASGHVHLRADDSPRSCL
ncbi:MAG: hypothetical protein J07HR59_00930 [Halorubrum sp. J07HR59]|nr:MAG: hypothetical protein J07HR59_00930 [Halorubrum sp. J07HR59]